MTRSSLRQIVPSLIMASAAAIPAITLVEILSQAGRGSTLGTQTSAPIAGAGPRTSSRTLSGRSPSAINGGTQTYRGPVVNDPFGGVQATISMSGRTIADVVISAPRDNPQSASINQQAIPLLRSETLRAQSAQVNTVSGATYTSQAYAQSLRGALARAQSQGNAPVPSGQAMAAGQKLAISHHGHDGEGDNGESD